MALFLLTFEVPELSNCNPEVAPAQAEELQKTDKYHHKKVRRCNIFFLFAIIDMLTKYYSAKFPDKHLSYTCQQ